MSSDRIRTCIIRAVVLPLDDTTHIDGGAGFEPALPESFTLWVYSGVRRSKLPADDILSPIRTGVSHCCASYVCGRVNLDPETPLDDEDECD